MRVAGQFQERIGQWPRTAVDLAATVGILLLCTLIGLLFLWLGLNEANMISVYILGVLFIASVTSHKGYGLFSSVAGVLLFNCIFADPKFTLFFYDKQYTIVAVLMLIASLMVSSFTARFRSQLSREAHHSRRTEALLSTSQSLLGAGDCDEILRVVSVRLHEMLDRPILLCHLVDGRPQSVEMTGHIQPELDVGVLEGRILAFLEKNCRRQPCVFSQEGLRLSFCPLTSHDKIYGMVGVIEAGTQALTPDEPNLLRAVLDETSLALDRYQLQALNQLMDMQAQAERLRSNLLRSVSHDLRTPLTSISGNADILLSSETGLDAQMRRQLYQNIYDDAEWLIQLVENLLFITKIENGTMDLHMEPELLQEIVSEAVAHMARRKKDHTIQVCIPDDLLAARVDAVLITQVLVNLIDNALKYTPTGSHIQITAFERDGAAVVEVADDGHGVGDKTHIFDMFYTGRGGASDARRGIGLGLGLCKAVVEAHGGQIYVRDNQPHGLVVGFTLQLERMCLV